MDLTLCNIVCDPRTHQSLRPLARNQLDQVNAAIASTSVLRADGSKQTNILTDALITEDGQWIFRIEDGIPVLLSEQAIDTQQFSTWKKT